MRFAVALPWWGYALAFAAALALAWLAYARVPLSPRHRTLLVGIRGLTLVLLVAILLRPVRFVHAEGPRESVVAILVDTSRSMRLSDADGPRIERARAIVEQLQAAIGTQFQTELFSFGESLARSTIAQLSVDARRSDLSGALAAVGERYRGRRLAGIVVVSDGGDTAEEELGGRPGTTAAPIFTIGVGSATPPRDREVINFTAGEPLLAGSSVDLSVTVSASGFGGDPVELRLKEDGRLLQTRRVTPAADGTPVHQLFTVSPSADRATVYSVEIPPDAAEIVTENNARSVLVPPQGRRRLVLLVEGAPGFEHTFLKRALARDTALEVDSVVRKGQNDEGRDTFFIQAGSGRTGALASGFPTTAEELFRYDAIFFGNIEGDFFTREQLAMTADFVARRGGGLLVFGARSFERAGLAGTPLEEVLPIDLTDRRAAVVRTAGGLSPATNGLAVTVDGATHAATRIAADVDESYKRWAQLPPLASVAVAGGPRPGAQVLAVSASPGGELRPLVVTQRYGLGRSMVFAGEASWRWRMMLPASDTSFEVVWRQLARWVASGAAERIEIPPTAVPLPGSTDTVAVVVRDAQFRPMGNATVALHVAEPGGGERTVTAPLADPSAGRYTAAVRFDQPGVYTVSADVRVGAERVGSASRPLLVGGVDLELTQPRLNEAVLRRVASRTGGEYVPASEFSNIPARLRDGDATKPPLEMQDVWHNGASLTVIIGLLALEWVLRRRVGLA
jgi:uncharacterized membrane protein